MHHLRSNLNNVDIVKKKIHLSMWELSLHQRNL